MTIRALRHPIILSLATLTLPGCSGPSPNEDLVTNEAVQVQGEPPTTFPQIEDNIHHDTLLIQTTFDLGDSTFVMVAGNVEETFEGIRLYRYRLLADSAAEIISVSPPGYDSWTMLPTFFPTDSTTARMWVLANMGERESWGQKLLWMDRELADLGFMDVALPERVMEDDTLRLKRRNVGPSVRMEVRNDTSYFGFACDSVYLYDDQAGRVDQVLPGHSVRYTFHRNEGLALWVSGKKRLVKRPS